MKDLGLPQKRRRWIFLILWAAEILFLLWKANKGFGNVDESLYLAIPHRLYQGDGLLSNEWNISMFSSWFMYPLFWAYMKIANSTEGIILSFRYIYVFAQAAISLFLYHKLEEKPGASGAVLFWMLYTPFNIMALSYNSMGIMGLTIFTVLLASEKQKRWWSPVLAGLALSGAVLGCPYLVIVYVYYAILVFWHQRTRKGRESYGFLFEKRGFVYVTATCASMAGLLLVSVFQKASLSCAMESVQLILSTTDHSMGFFDKVGPYFASAYQTNAPAGRVIVLMLLTCAAYFLDRKRKPRKALYFVAFCVLCCLYAVIMLRKKPYVNFMVIPVVLLGFFCFLMTEQKEMPLLLGAFIPAILYSFAIHWASNQEYYVIASAMSVAIIPSVLFIHALVGELPSPRYHTIGVLAICVLLSCLFWTRLHFTFWDQSPRYLNTQIEEGPNRGIYTTQEWADSYNSLQKATEQIRKEEGYVLYFSHKTWLPLADEKRMASYSPWLFNFNGDNEQVIHKLKIYYSIHPESVPDWIFVDSETNIPAEQLLAALELHGTVTQEQGHEIIDVDK